MQQITLRAAAKLNMTLDITGVRPDGYHLLQMVMQTVSLYDTLTLRREERISLLCDHLPNPDNLAWRAAEAFFAHTGVKDGVRITLDKQIPIQSGMAGGSADAAAVLKGLDILYETHLGLPALRELGLSLGADVPYCLMGGTALVEGIGEQVIPVPQMRTGAFAILKPEWGVSTAAAFAAYDSGIPADRPNPYRVIDCLMKGKLKSVSPYMRNLLEQSADRYPEIAELRRRLLKNGALAAQMTGSGSAVFGLFPDLAAAKACAAAAARPDERSFAAEPVPQGVEVLLME